MNFKRSFECPTGWCDCDSCKDNKGQEENGTIICGRRPKQFKCVCGCQEFVLVKRAYTRVDFSQEGTVKGHPLLHNAGGRFEHFACLYCFTVVPDEQAQEMLKEVL